VSIFPTKPSAARADDPVELARGSFLVGREHHAVRRERRVERRVREGQRFRVPLDEVDREPFGLGALASPCEQPRDVVEAGDAAEASRRGKRRVAVAAGDVEDHRARVEVGGFTERLSDELESGADHREVAGSPGGLLARLHRRQIDGDDRRWTLARGAIDELSHGCCLL
jgi:hypothetical protein